MRPTGACRLRRLRIQRPHRLTATSLPNPSAGIDALRLAAGRFLLVHNPTPSGRSRLELSASRDGRSW